MSKFRLFAAASAVAVLMALVPTASAQASSLYGQDPYATGCASSSYTVYPPANRSYNGSLIVRDKTTQWAGVVRIVHSRYCGTAWAEFSGFSPFGGEVSIWNSWNQNRKARVWSGGWARTTMVDDVPGVTTCVGTQVYINNYTWRNWDMGFCW